MRTTNARHVMVGGLTGTVKTATDQGLATWRLFMGSRDVTFGLMEAMVRGACGIM